MAQARVLGILGIGVDLDRQRVGGRQHLDVLHRGLDLARRELRVHGLGAPGHHPPRHRDDALEPEPLGHGELRVARMKHALDEAVVVTEIYEQEAAVIAFAVDPPRQAGHGADVRAAQLATRMGPVGGDQRRGHAPPPLTGWLRRARHSTLPSSLTTPIRRNPRSSSSWNWRPAFLLLISSDTMLPCSLSSRARRRAGASEAACSSITSATRSRSSAPVASRPTRMPITRSNPIEKPGAGTSRARSLPIVRS